MIIGKWEFFSIAKNNSMINEYILKTFYHLIFYLRQTFPLLPTRMFFPEHLQFNIFVV
jgi:hypothetical protein